MTNLEVFSNAKLDVRKNVQLKDYLSLKIGGDADYFIEPSNVSEINQAIDIAKSLNLKYFVIGNGSNTLALDYGVRGLVIYLGPKFSKIELLENNIIKAESGALLKDVCMFAQSQGLSGMEPLYGIPASVGGAIYMNAGAYDGEIKDVVLSVDFIDENNQLNSLSNAESDFGYRHSYYMDKAGIVTAAYFKLQVDKAEDIQARMDDFLNRRESKQPLEWPSAGSTFKRPNFHYASALIDICGLKGYAINDIKVSEKHAGFLINVGCGTSKDFIDLVNHIHSTVYAQTGFKLDPEIQILK
ncbi:MAG: UDP-N-acetylmuramate dehydrogenase [Erysipelothrix sp.]|nr:UDP-N-acetylmuramate dehydrogenase [Erysipelothrix sp.]